MLNSAYLFMFEIGCLNPELAKVIGQTIVSQEFKVDYVNSHKAFMGVMKALR